MYEVDLWNLGTVDGEMWETRQGMLIGEIYYNRILPLIEIVAGNDDVEKHLKTFTSTLIQTSFPYIFRERKENPAHHPFQVLENSLWGTKYEFGESADESEIIICIALALLHDTGRAKDKVTTGDIEEEIKAGKSEEEIRDCVRQAIEFRTEHMENGKALARKLLNGNLVRDCIEPDQVDEVCATIGIHDYPTIAFILDEYGKYVKGNAEDYLFSSPEHDRAIAFREKDRLWMVSKEGLEKDSISNILKGKDKPSRSLQAQLLHNVKRFRQERDVYVKYQGDSGDFWEDTFFKNKGSVCLFKKFLRQWSEFPQMREDKVLREVFSKYLG